MVLLSAMPVAWAQEQAPDQAQGQAQGQAQVPNPPPVEMRTAVDSISPDTLVAGQEADPQGSLDAPQASLTVETISDELGTVPQAPAATLLGIANAKQYIRDSTLTPEALTSLFFTAWQHELLQEAKMGFRTGRPGSGADGSAVAADPGNREISLGGIAYSSDKRWTVWLNGVRITPGALPRAIIDIKVNRAYIDLKWFDAYTNRIYPVRLRPQERFNLDSRIFLPGTGAM